MMCFCLNYLSQIEATKVLDDIYIYIYIHYMICYLYFRYNIYIIYIYISFLLYVSYYILYYLWIYIYIINTLYLLYIYVWHCLTYPLTRLITHLMKTPICLKLRWRYLAALEATYEEAIRGTASAGRPLEVWWINGPVIHMIRWWKHIKMYLPKLEVMKISIVCLFAEKSLLEGWKFWDVVTFGG